MILFDSVDHIESLIVRFRSPLGKACHQLPAMWLGYDHNGEVASGGMLLTRNELDEMVVKHEISKHIDNPSTATLMGLR